jgi:DNA-binding NarL/FixJ family response regulator
MSEIATAPHPRPGLLAPRLSLVEPHRPTERDRWSGSAALTTRECDVLRLMADGLSTREVARRMAYSERTIKNILQDLTTRLQLRNRTQAVAYAVRQGWI